MVRFPNNSTLCSQNNTHFVPSMCSLHFHNTDVKRIIRYQAR